MLAPPFDVIGDAQAASLRARSEYNAVRIVLPEGVAPDRYELAGARLAEWIREDILRARGEEIYVYRQEFVLAGRSSVRHALLAAVELTDFERGEVLPHEDTHRGPKEDRLALMKACMAQLSPIFFIARDSGRTLRGLIDACPPVDPILEATTEDGIRHAVRAVPVSFQAAILDATGASDLLIADGHHRYETALELARQMPERTAARRVLGAIVSDADSGLIVRATHRRLTGLPASWLDVLHATFVIDPGPADPSALAEEVRRRGDPWIGLSHRPAPDRREGHLLRARAEAVEESGLPEASAGLACVLCDHLVLRPLTGRGPDDAAADGLLSYHPEPEVAAASSGEDAAALLLPPLQLASLWDVAREGARLPPKSTYFAPKMPSGLLFRPI